MYAHHVYLQSSVHELHMAGKSACGNALEHVWSKSVRETRPGQEHNGLIYVMAVLTVEPDIGGEQPRKRFHAIRAQLGDGGVSAGGEHAEQRLHAMLALALRHAVQPGVQRAAEISRALGQRGNRVEAVAVHKPRVAGMLHEAVGVRFDDDHMFARTRLQQHADDGELRDELGDAVDDRAVFVTGDDVLVESG